VTARPVIPRDRARRDVEAAIDYYVDEAGAQAGLDFIEALEAAYEHIANHPATGSPRHAHELNLPGLRCWHLKRFPYLIFYATHPDHVDVWRVLHARRDIPDWLREGE